MSVAKTKTNKARKTSNKSERIVWGIDGTEMLFSSRSQARSAKVEGEKVTSYRLVPRKTK
jgi:hypothetical protein